MKSYKELIQESYINLLGPSEEKDKIAEEVFALLTSSYEREGGLKGKGFKNPNDMVASIPFWKINRVDGKIIMVAMYRDKEGRKLVAIGAQKTPEAKAKLVDFFKTEFERAYVEVSGSLLRFLVNNVDIKMLAKYVKTVSEVKEIIGDKIKPGDSHKIPLSLISYLYSREINGEMHTKIMFGTHGKVISW
jgi:hypothetical protein